MNAAANLHSHLNEKAIEVSGRYRKTEAEFIEVLENVDQHKVYLHYGSVSLFDYVIRHLRLSESVAYNLIAVTRKAREVPALKAAIEAGNISLSNARRVAPVLTPENQTEWLEKARSLSQRQLEKEIVKVRPEAATPERATYVTPNRVKLELGLTEQNMLNLRRAQDLLSQSKGRALSLEDVLVAMTGEFLQKRDPVLKAKRVQVKKGFSRRASVVAASEKESGARPATDPAFGAKSRFDLDTVSDSASDFQPPIRRPMSDSDLNPPVSIQAHGEHEHKHEQVREAIPVLILHQVQLRDEGKCTFKMGDEGPRCGSSRFIDIHHQVPVSKGGKNTVENLVTLCRTHHQWVHTMNSRKNN